MTIPNSLRWCLVVASVLGLAACQARPEPPVLISTPAPALLSPASLPDADPSRTTFAFEPFTGAPGNIADNLSKAIGEEASKQGLVLVRRIGAPATYRVNGYLSATGETSSASIFYVFDIVDNSGKRLKRISGIERISGTNGDPWEAVNSAALERIAARSVVEMNAWINRQ
ncbi:hypothetical protein [Roseibium algae]|uniref:Lipoprotein n=1 Tax=Roseibium algae TaxID=3123038 RepID=A0ABU8TG97_9HYPH